MASILKVFKLLTLISLLKISLFGATSDNFLTIYEYSKMLYNNPKGISCASCHGLQGEKRRYIEYFHEKKKRNVKIMFRPLYELTYKRFKRGLTKKQRFMPKYILSDLEIKTLYYYLLKKNNMYLTKSRVPKKKSFKSRKK